MPQPFWEIFKTTLHHGLKFKVKLSGLLPGESDDDAATVGQLNEKGSSSLETITQTLTSGTNDVSHTLGVEPKTWIIQDSTGRMLTYAANPKSGSETTTLEVTALIETTNAKITVFA